MDCSQLLDSWNGRRSWSVAAASWWSPIASPPRCPRPPRPPHCEFAMSLPFDERRRIGANYLVLLKARHLASTAQQQF
eukprot:7388377-Prymnesium_polylepis.1